MLAFGTTTAMVDHFRDAAADSKQYPFHHIPMSSYMAVFQSFALRDSRLAGELRVDGWQTALRGNLGAMLQQLLGREPRKHELEAWFGFLVFDTSCTLGAAEYTAGVERLVEWSAAPAAPRTFTSWTLKESHRWVGGGRGGGVAGGAGELGSRECRLGAWCGWRWRLDGGGASE
jgi:hypothetical protein